MTPLVVRAPLSGVVTALAAVPDPVFAGELVGPGLAIDPTRETGEGKGEGDGEVNVAAPIDGTIVKVHPHAFLVAGSDGRAVLVHLGLDTVQLRGAGFTVLAAEGDRVSAGDVVVTWHPTEVEAGGRSPVCPVIALEAAAGAVAPLADVGSTVAAGAPLFTWD